MPSINNIKNFINNSSTNFAIYLLIAFAIAGVAILVAVLTKKSKIAILIERLVLVLGVTALIAIPMAKDFEGFNAMEFFFTNNLDAYLLLALFAALILGIFTEGSYMTQGLYGALIAISLPFSLLNLVFPFWAKDVKTIGELFGNATYTISFLVFALMLFIPVWLIASGSYKLRLTSVWHVLGGLALGGAGVIFLWETDFLHSKVIVKAIHLFNSDEPLTTSIEAFISVVLIFIAFMLVLGLTATLIRKYAFKSDERVLSSETWAAFFIRMVGRVIAIGLCGGGALFMPGWLSDAAETPLGLPKALLFLIPIALFGVVMLFTEFLAEYQEIKHAIAKARAEEMAAEAEMAKADAAIAE